LIALAVGLFKFNFGGRRVYLIVFENICNATRIPKTAFAPLQIFDLKGRIPKKDKALKNVGVEGHINKDKDLNRKFSMNPVLFERFHAQLERDVAFLRHNNLMDYSILIGVARRTQTEPIPIVEEPGRPFFRSHFGGRLADDQASEIYYIGIIDYLTDYNYKKKIAHRCKRFLWQPRELSTIEAPLYAHRLLTYAKTIVVRVGENVQWVPGDFDYQTPKALPPPSPRGSSSNQAPLSAR
jgi:hypothetical protein